MKSNTVSMCVFWFVITVMGVIEVFFEKLAINEIYVVGSGAITMFLILVWFIEDSRNINHTPSLLLKISVLFVPFITIPYYLIKYKGWRRSLRSISIFLSWIILYLAIVFLSTFIAEHLVWAS